MNTYSCSVIYVLHTASCEPFSMSFISCYVMEGTSLMTHKAEITATLKMLFLFHRHAKLTSGKNEVTEKQAISKPLFHMRNNSSLKG